MNIDRRLSRNLSNNRTNPNKNICTSSITGFFNCTHLVRYLHRHTDVVRALRIGGYQVRSRSSQVKNRTIGRARARFADITLREGKPTMGYLVRIQGHVLLLDCKGNTIVDTDSRVRDKRKILNAYKITQKEVLQ